MGRCYPYPLDEWTTVSRCSVFFFQAEDGIRDLVRSRGLGDVYKRQLTNNVFQPDGKPIRVVVAPEIVYGARSAARAQALSLIHI